MKERKRPGVCLLLLLAAVMGFLGYCLGYVRANERTYGFSVSTTYPATQAEQTRGGDAIPETAEEGEEPAAPAAQAEPEEGQTVTRIDLNHADAETLQQLPGIGPKRAEAIIQYREEYGLFASTQEITKVPGIGEELYEQIKDLVTVEYRDLS